MVRDTLGCEVEATETITAPAIAVEATATQSFIGCFDANDSEANVVGAGGTGTNYTYEWSELNGTTVANNANANNLAAQEYIATVIDENGCEAYDTIVITQLDEIMINLIQVPPSCNGLTDGQIGVNIVTGGIFGSNGMVEDYDFQWNNNNNTALNSNIGAGVYEVVVSDAQGCTNSTSLTLNQPPPITATASITDALCFGSSDGQIEVTSQGAGNSFTYQWAPNANNQTTSTATGLGQGTYAVIITDDDGCTADTSFIVGEPMEIAIEFVTEDNPCSGDMIGAISTTITGGVPDFDYSWTSTNTGFTSSNASLSGLSAGDYILNLTDANGCVQTSSTQITSPPELSAITEVDSVSCFGDADGHIHIEAQGGSGPFQYSIDGENFTSGTDFLGLEAGNYTIYVLDKEGCTYEINNEVGSPEEIIVDLGENLNIDFGQAANLVANITPVGNYSYFWTPTDSLNCVNCENIFNPSAIGLSNQTTFAVEVINEFGCSAEDLITVFVNKNRKVFVPTAFSPNSDGHNDLLRTHGEEGTTVLTFKVFDRWGELVYENTDSYGINDLDIGWDGNCLLYTSPSPRDATLSRMPSSA